MKLKFHIFLLVMVLLAACTPPSASNTAGTPAVVPNTAGTPSNTATAAGTASVVPTVVTPSPVNTTAAPSATAPAATVTTLAPTSTSTVTASQTASALTATVTPMTLPTSVENVGPTATPVTPGAPTPTAAPSVDSFLNQYMPRRVKVGETQHYIFYQQDNYAPVDMTWWMQQAEIIYAYDVTRLNGAQVKDKISIGFLAPDTRACPVRGLASFDQHPDILIYADKNSTQTYLLSVLAHETGHAISYEFPEGIPGANALAEGLASYTAGKYWAAWFNVPTIDDLVRRYIQEGQYEPISENYDLHGLYPWQSGTGHECLARRDKVYSEWASFLGYLINTYGWDKAHQLFKLRTEVTGGKRITYPPDYQGIYGKALNQLEQDWLGYLKNGNS